MRYRFVLGGLSVLFSFAYYILEHIHIKKVGHFGVFVSIDKSGGEQCDSGTNSMRKTESR
jgi:hypothetical protein